MQGYARAVRRVLAAVLAVNLTVAVGKIVAGRSASSLSLVGDGLHSMVDALNNLVALVLVYVASRPPDPEHPYGHGKFETVGAFALSGLLFITAVELGRAGIERLAAGAVAPHYSPLTLLVILATLIVNLTTTILERRAAARLGSEILKADVAHTASDVAVTLAVLGGVVATNAGYAWVDPALAIVVAVVIAFAGYRVFQSAAPILTDRIVYDPDVVADLVRGVPGVTNVHDIRSRGRPGEAFVQMHLVVDTGDVVAAHAITEEVEDLLARTLGAKEVLIHVEPFDDTARAA